MLDAREFHIDGRWVAPQQGTDFEVIDPATEEAYAVISLGGQADTDAAVAAARAAFPSWMQTSPEERIALVERLLEVYEARADEMGQAISREMGAPIDWARGQQVGAGTWHIRNFLRAAKEFTFERPLGDHAPQDRIVHEPVGVVGMITPWNWPMNQLALKIIPALLTGCTAVVKPSELAPMSTRLFTEFVVEAGFPAGVVNLVNGDGAGVGTQLTVHPDVDMISFTGSTRAGIAITKNAADTLKRVTLELGGKGANIVFADADAKAIAKGAQRCFANTGQSCNAPTRMLVERAVYDDAVAGAVEAADATQVGPSDQPGRHIGPLVSQAQFDKVQALIQSGIDEGARLVAGGLGRPEGIERGYYVRPTVFADVSNDMTIAREEIFGPVLSIIPFETEDEAIAIANDTPYGLTNFVQTDDDEKRVRVARQLRSGMVETNYRGFGAGSPFGGMKASGNGREAGTWGLEEYLEVKAVSGWPAG